MENLLKNAHPEMGGLQSTLLGINLSCTIEKGKFVKIINIRNNHCITISNTKCQSNHIGIYDSKPSNELLTEAKEQIAAPIYSIEKQFPIHLNVAKKIYMFVI